MPVSLRRLALSVLVTLVASSVAFGQGGTTASISGTVVDSSGLLVPGATVTITDTATNTTFEAVTGARGAFNVPALNPGTYTITIALQGFKTAVLEDVVLNAGEPTSVRATLELGELTETVVVSGAGSIVQTQTSSVATTLNVRQISNLPLTSRGVLEFVINLPGVNTPGGSRNSQVNGLPQSALNITLDGINVQDNTLKSSDGFFAIVNPRVDAIEEVTVSGASQGADASGQGAVQIRFVTRSGSNDYAGSVYWYVRSDKLNENSWFNIRDDIEKPKLKQNQVGFRVGGPLSIPGLFDGRDKLFFFVNYEEFRQPSDIGRLRTVMSPEAQAGLFRYNTSGGVRSVNLFELAAANGQLATMDPIVRNLLADIRAATGTTGTILDLTDPNIQDYRYNVARRSHNRYPTVRVDYNVTDNHRLSTSWNYQRFLSTPDTLNNRDPRFPGFPATADQTSTRLAVSNSLRSTLRSNLVNEVRVGYSGAPVEFFTALSPSMWSGDLANQGGFYLNISTAGGITNASNSPTPSSRNAFNWLVEDTVTWLKGDHSITLGGSWNQVDIWRKNQTLLPTINFDIVNGDPAEDLFTTSNFPGASSSQIADAGDLYAVLTGRVSAINSNAAINPDTNKFVYNGLRHQEGRLRQMGFYAQDSWRIRPDLTLNYGVRYELQFPFTPKNDSYSNSTLEDVWGISGLASTCTNPSAVNPNDCNLFKPGLMPGKAITEYYPFKKGENAYNMDLNNIAPSVGVAWTPSRDDGFLGRFLGSPGDTVLRGGFARSFNRPGMTDFTSRYDDNPGLLITVNRSLSEGNLGPLPVLLREPGTLGPPPFQEEREYPMTDTVTGDVAIFDPNIQVPYNDTWTLGYQRALGTNHAMEIRYVGTRSRDLWGNYNYNEVNILENGFLDEFKLAQANLAANIAAGRGNTFRYYGAGTGTSPLPILLAYFSGRSDASNAAAYSSSSFRSSSWYNRLARMNPDPFGFANALDSSSSRRANALRAGLPDNFLVANPNKLGGAEVNGNGGYTNYNSLQLELRRRMSAGLQFQTSYVFGRAYISQFYSFRVPRLEVLDTGDEGGVTHALKANWVYELPFGQGKRWGSNVGGALDRLIGGWQIHGTARFQSGEMVNFGNVRMVGFTKKDLEGFYKIRLDQDQRVWMLPQDVIDNTVKAFSVSATSPTGYSSQGVPEGRYFAPANGPDCIETIDSDYGSCGARQIVVHGPMYKNMDLSITKLIPLKGTARLEFRFEMLNAFNWVNYNPVTGIGSNPSNYEVTGLNGVTQSRITQIVSRFTW